MLISIVLTLVSDVDLRLPGHVGRANHAETLTRLETVDAALGSAIHQLAGVKPLTCSSLLDAKSAPDGLHVLAGQAVHVRMTGLNAAVSTALHVALIERRPATWRLAEKNFAVVDATCEAEKHPWAGKTTCETLAASHLLSSSRAVNEVELHFASPTAFHSKEMTMPVPLPDLVFGSLVDRWNAFSPVTISPEIRRYGAEVMAISRYRLESWPVEQKGQGVRVGGVGRVRYSALSNDRYWLAVMQMLADFALYSGVGVMTTTGMGQARRI
jgi:CRISPR-associated endoribonuclease Cas6